jgi:trehalose 6-phosphate phosphatase
VFIDTIDLRTSAVLLDVDGTLLDIAETPPDVEVPARLRQALRAVRGQTDGATAFVSGRPLAELDRLFAPLRLAAVAGHGAELRITGKSEPHRYNALIGSDLRKQFAAFAKSHDGIIVEDKGYSLALHYRLAPQLAAEVHDFVAAARAHYPPRSLEVLMGKAVVEVKSNAFNKGTGIRELLKFPPFQGRRPVFIGDDVTDESAFAVLPEFDGLGFSVGRELPGLAGCFSGPRDVREWLYRVADTVGETQS